MKSKDKLAKPQGKQKKPRGYHHGDLKAALVVAALKLIREKGPRGFSLNEAARLAGVSVAAPYRHFTDKEALLAEVIREGNELLEKELREAAAVAGELFERLLAVNMAYIQFAEQHADYFAVMFGSGIDKSKYPEMRMSAVKAFSVLEDLAREVEPSATLARVHAVTCWVSVHGLASLSAEGALTHASNQPFDDETFRSLLKRIIQQEFNF